MGSFLSPVTLMGPEGEATIEAQVGTGAGFMRAPRSLLERLGIQPVRKHHFSLADGRVIEYEIGNLTIRLAGKMAPTPCVFGDPDDEPLIGTVALASCLLGVDPVNQTLVPVVGRLKTPRGPLVRASARFTRVEWVSSNGPSM